MAVYSKMNSIKPRDQVIQEAYFGKTPELQEAERILGEWRSKYYGSGNRFVTSAAADPLFYEFCDKMADIFGFAEYLVVLRGDIESGSSTIPVGFLFTGHNSEVIKTKNGYKYDGTPVMVQYCYPYMLFNEEFSDAEVMAVFLHEIGHSFSHKASTVICMHHIIKMITLGIYLIFKIIRHPLNTIEDILLLTNEGRKVYKTLQETFNKNNKSVALILSYIKFCLALPNSMQYNIDCILNRFAGPGRIVLQFIKSLIKNGVVRTTIGISNERIADNFATIYGYGPELYTSLHKMGIDSTISVKYIHQVPGIGWIYDLISIPQRWMITLGNEHPTTASRRKSQIHYLEAEMKKEGLSPSARKAILKDLEQFDKDLTEIENRAKKLGGSSVLDEYQVLVNKLDRGDDPRSVFYNYTRDMKRMDRLGESTTIDTSIIDNVDLL